VGYFNPNAEYTVFDERKNAMIIGVERITIYEPSIHSLKEKRMVVKSLCARVKNKFNVSIAEVDKQDIHQVICLAFACVTSGTGHADSILDKVLNFIESNIQGEIISIEREFR